MGGERERERERVLSYNKEDIYSPKDNGKNFFEKKKWEVNDGQRVFFFLIRF